jgi:RNA polymerase-binding protein DksA
VPPKPKAKAKTETASKPKRAATTKAAAKRPAPKAAAAKAARPAVVKPLPKPLPKKYQRIREYLLEEMARLRADLKDVEMRTSRITESEVASEAGGYDDHPADMASETYEREKDLALGENLQDILGKIRIALEKMDQGTYGTCDACGEKIAPERLEALPFATLCVRCQGRLEGR